MALTLHQAADLAAANTVADATTDGNSRIIFYDDGGNHGVVFSAKGTGLGATITKSSAALSDHLVDGITADTDKIDITADGVIKATITKAQLKAILDSSYEPTITVKNDAFNKAFGTVAGSVAEGSALATKQDTLSGHGLSAESFTLDEKTKLGGLEDPLYKGVFASLVALQTAHPFVAGPPQTPAEGSTARVSPVTAGDPIAVYNFSSGVWVVEVGASTEETAVSIRTKLLENADTNVVTDIEKVAIGTIGDKVDKVSGKVLSDQNFTLAEKQQLQELAAGNGSSFIESIEDLDVHLESLNVGVKLEVNSPIVQFNRGSFETVDDNISIRVDENLECIRFRYSSENDYPAIVVLHQRYSVKSHGKDNEVFLEGYVENGQSKGKKFGSHWGNNYEMDGNNHIEGQIFIQDDATNRSKVYDFVGHRRRSAKDRTDDNGGKEFSLSFTISGESLSSTGVNL